MREKASENSPSEMKASKILRPKMFASNVNSFVSALLNLTLLSTSVFHHLVALQICKMSLSKNGVIEKYATIAPDVIRYKFYE